LKVSSAEINDTKKHEIKKRPGEKCLKPVREAFWRKYYNSACRSTPKMLCRDGPSLCPGGGKACTFKPFGWFCPECAGFVVRCPHSSLKAFGHIPYRFELCRSLVGKAWLSCPCLDKFIDDLVPFAVEIRDIYNYFIGLIRPLECHSLTLYRV